MPEENDKKESDTDDIVIDETENIEDTPKAETEEILSDQKNYLYVKINYSEP